MNSYTLIEKNGSRYVANMNGDVLYDATGISPQRIAAMVKNGEYVNWRIHHLAMEPPNTPGMGAERRIYNKGKWFNEGDNVLDVMIQHPKRTYKDCVLMATMEGLRIDEQGILRRIAE